MMQSPTIMALGNTAGPRSFSTCAATTRVTKSLGHSLSGLNVYLLSILCRARASESPCAPRHACTRAAHRHAEGLHGLLLQVGKTEVLHLAVEALDVEAHVEGKRLASGHARGIDRALGAAELHAAASRGRGEEAAGLEGGGACQEREKQDTLALRIEKHRQWVQARGKMACPRPDPPTPRTYVPETSNNGKSIAYLRLAA